MTDFIEALDSPDHMALGIFAQTAPPMEVNLTENLQAVPTRLYDMQSGHYDRMTNIGGGIARARDELKSSRSRDTAKKVIVLMSDGVANVNEAGYNGRDYARYQADLAADDGMMIYTVSVGYGVDRPLMQEIAQKANGQEFYAAAIPRNTARS